MRFMQRTLFAAATLVALSGASAATQTFRCSNDLVQVGDNKSAVLAKCGAPVLKDSFCKPVPVRPAIDEPKRGNVIINAPCETVDEWTFNPGYGQFMTTLRFESGKLVSITYGDRVK
ncbi:MAG TPA: DUF2845 domain-containing protein [Rubrivivax sp.]|nr:DUF2845 domain-containing protein [Rubrivivax sp.]